MQTGSPYALINEMLETPGVLRRFSPDATKAWRKNLDAKPLFLTGEGSSRIFPAKHAVHLARRLGRKQAVVTEGARQAAEYDLSSYGVVGVSNSGRTREIVTLFEALRAKDIETFVVTAAAGSRITELSAGVQVLSCGAEQATAASKTVVEQALILQSLVDDASWGNLDAAADAMEAVLRAAPPRGIVEMLKDAPVVYFAGRNDGVAEELALKANEIARVKSMYLEGTYALHGIEEVMRRGEALVLIDPCPEDLAKYDELLAQRAGVNVVAIAGRETPFPDLLVPEVTGFGVYLRLAAGWSLLVETGLARGVNIDKAERARKIGNEISNG